ncbi:Ran GTPase-activating protein, partial [Pseudoloma neurophilia]
LLTFHEKRIFTTAESVKELTDKINDSYDSFDFAMNTFHFEAFEVLMDCLSKIKVRKLVLHNAFATMPKEEVEKCLNCFNKLNPLNLEHLDLTDNAISTVIPPFLFDFLIRCSNLKVLKVRNCGFGAIGAKNLSDAIKDIKNKDSLQYVDISQNRMLHGAKHIFEVLSEFKNLKSFLIKYNSISSETMDDCIPLIKDHNLELFDITDNALSPKSCKVLGTAFQNIDQLEIGDCLMGDEGLKEFINGFLDNKPHVKIIEPVKNDDLVDKTKKEEKVKKLLNISYNDLTQDSIDLIVENFTILNLKKLIIYGNDEDDILQLEKLATDHGTELIFTDPEDLDEDDIIPESLIKEFERIL